MSSSKEIRKEDGNVIIPEDAFNRLKRDYLVLKDFTEWVSKSGHANTGESLEQSAKKTLDILKSE